VGDAGYEAVIEWSRVQEERPSSSTSGGQSGGGPVAACGWVVVDFVTFLVCDVKSA
jgi:hypothetical protein